MTIKKENKIFWDFKNLVSNESVDLYIYDEIAPFEDGECTSATAFKKDLDNVGDIKSINLYVNSPGGSVGDGLAIANMLKRHPAYVTAYVDGLACSISSVIVCSANKVIMYRNSMQMIHDALAGGFMYNNAKGFRKLADDLDKMTESLRQTYLEKSNGKLDEDKLTTLMSEESWLSAKDCYDIGLCDEVLDNNKMVASMSAKFSGFFNSIPQNVIIENDNNEEDEINQVDEVAKENEALKEENEKLKQDKEELQNQFNEATEKILALNEDVKKMKDVVDKYNKEQEAKLKIELENKINEKMAYYENKFTSLNAESKFNSNEVQELIKNCVTDDEAKSKLNLILVDLIEIEDKKFMNKSTIEQTTKIENLIPTSETIEDKYGFK